MDKQPNPAQPVRYRLGIYLSPDVVETVLAAPQGTGLPAQTQQEVMAAVLEAIKSNRITIARVGLQI